MHSSVFSIFLLHTRTSCPVVSAHQNQVEKVYFSVPIHIFWGTAWYLRAVADSDSYQVEKVNHIVTVDIAGTQKNIW